MILDRPAGGREPDPLRSPLNTEESTETSARMTGLCALVIMAGPPTAPAMSGIHQQHDPADVKSLGDAIHFSPPTSARERNRSEAGKP